MAITKVSGRQEVVAAIVDYALADLTSGTAVAAVELPANARVVAVTNKIGTAFNSGTSDALVIQSNEDTPKAYITIGAGAGALSAGLTSVSATTNLGFKNTVKSTIDVKWTGVGTAATTGTGTLIVEYVVDKRQTFSQGADSYHGNNA